MALTRADYVLWKSLADDKLVPPNPSLLEIGQALWYGDMPPVLLQKDVQERAPELTMRFKQALWALYVDRDRALFEIAELFYLTFVKQKRRVAIDLDPNSTAYKYDLNRPMDIVEQFDVVANSGTAEHVFNQCQLFQTVHDLTAPGGLMVHALPAAGWHDHGFYNYNPTFVEDLATWNSYEIVKWLVARTLYDNGTFVRIDVDDYETHGTRTERNEDVTMHVALRKVKDQPFNMLMQGRYAKPG